MLVNSGLENYNDDSMVNSNGPKIKNDDPDMKHSICMNNRTLSLIILTLQQTFNCNL